MSDNQAQLKHHPHHSSVHQLPTRSLPSCSSAQTLWCLPKLLTKRRLCELVAPNAASGSSLAVQAPGFGLCVQARSGRLCNESELNTSWSLGTVPGIRKSLLV